MTQLRKNWTIGGLEFMPKVRKSNMSFKLLFVKLITVTFAPN